MICGYCNSLGHEADDCPHIKPQKPIPNETARQMAERLGDVIQRRYPELSPSQEQGIADILEAELSALVEDREGLEKTIQQYISDLERTGGASLIVLRQAIDATRTSNLKQS